MPRLRMPTRSGCQPAADAGGHRRHSGTGRDCLSVRQTFAILSATARSALITGLHALRTSAGLRIAFDSNCRPKLWTSVAEARQAVAKLWELADIALPSVDTEMARFGDLTAQSVAARITAAGCQFGALNRSDKAPLPGSSIQLPPVTASMVPFLPASSTAAPCLRPCQKATFWQARSSGFRGRSSRGRRECSAPTIWSDLTLMIPALG